MRKALFILGQLNDADVAWLGKHGTKRQLADGDVLVREGRPLDALFITLDGQLSVTLQNGEVVASLSVGEVIGEIAFVDSSPPSATVTASGRAVVLALAKSVLQERLAADAPFAARFYRALAIFLADRLRSATHRLGYGSAGDLTGEEALKDELDFGVLDSVSQAGERFTRLLRTLSGA
jgi:CRP/FNR family transcriptional regulator, cyclic AMP receptor protein